MTLFLEKMGVFSCEFCQMFQNSFFSKHLWMIDDDDDDDDDDVDADDDELFLRYGWLTKGA